MMLNIASQVACYTLMSLSLKLDITGLNNSLEYLGDFYIKLFNIIMLLTFEYKETVITEIPYSPALRLITFSS